jgi:hypothetical protein
MNLGSDGIDVLVYTPGCGCASCIEVEKKAELERTGDHIAYLSRFMVVCPNCGNKRCPKATHHSYDCTGSNEPNQPGSWYQYSS